MSGVRGQKVMHYFTKMEHFVLVLEMEREVSGSTWQNKKS